MIEVGRKDRDFFDLCPLNINPCQQPSMLLFMRTAQFEIGFEEAIPAVQRSFEMGSVHAGKVAALVILEDNPLSDIRNTQKINAVIVNGKYFYKADIAGILDVQRKDRARF